MLYSVECSGDCEELTGMGVGRFEHNLFSNVFKICLEELRKPTKFIVT